MIYFLDNSLQLQKIVTSKNVISAIHEHELNGLIRADVELDLFYANKFLVLGIDHVGYYYKDEFYLHKIQRVEYDHVNESAKVVLRHIFFEDMIFGKLIQDVRPQNQNALTVSRQTIDANTRWQTIMSDVTGRLSTNFYWQVPYEVIEFMTKNYRIEYFPKILFDGQNINGFQLHLANKIGEDKNIRIPYGSRVLDLKYEEDYSEIITKLVVHGKGEEVGDGYGRRVNISDVNFSRNGVESPVGSLYLEDESITNTYGNDGQTPREGREVFEDIEDANELAEAGYQHYLQVSRPQMLFTADVADIGDVGIGDSVMIIRREYDVYFNARIHKLSVDLLYPEDAQVELGDYEHFKESKVERKTREKNNRVQGQLSDRITRLKLEANERFDNEVAQWKGEFEQALIDAHAQIEADRENMTNLIEGTRTEFTDNLDAEITQTKEYAEQQAQAKAESVQSSLDSFKGEHQQLYDEVTGNLSQTRTDLLERINNIDTQSFNLIRGSRFDEPDRYATSGGTVHDDEDMPYFRYGISSGNIQYIATVDDIQFESGKTYTLSLDYRTSSDVSIDYLRIIPTDGSADINIRNNITESDMAGVIPDGLWHRTFLTFTVPRNLTGTLRLGSNFSTSVKGQTDIRLPYLTTSGNVQWVFHPSDSYESIISVMSRIDEFEQSVWAELGDVYDDLSSTRTELQNQLDDARAELEGIEVGGRNLVLNTGGKLYRTFGSSATLSEVDGATRLDWTGSYQTAMGEKLSVPLITGETYTVTFEAKGTIASPYLEVYILASSGANLEFSSALSDRVVTEEFKKYTATFKYTNVSPSDRLFIGGRGPAGRWLEVKDNTVKLEKGNIATDWTPAPEDTEYKITTLNQQIEYIDGQLSAKLEQTDIDPINNKITEYGNSLTANAQSIESLINKTELHEGDITQWSNLTTETAEGLEQTIGRVSTAEGKLSVAEFDIKANADSLKLTATKTEVESAIDSIEVGGRNIIPNSANLLDWSKWSLNTSIIKMPRGMHRVSRVNPATGGAIGIHSKDGFVLKAGNQYTLSYKALDYYGALPNYIYILSSEQGNTQLRNLDIKLLGRTGTLVNQSVYANQYKLTFTFTKDVKDGQILIGYNGGTTSHPDIGFYISDVQLEKGNQVSDWSPAPEDTDAKISKVTSDFEIEAGRIEGLVTDISTDYVKQSSVKVTSDRVTIGSTIVNGSTIGSVLSVSPSGIDAVADAMRLSGDLFVAGDITALAVDAIEGNFARLFASSLTTNVIKSNHIQTDTALVEKLFATNANIDELVTRTHFSNSIKTLSIDAVHADLSSVNSEIMTTNILKSDWIDVDNAIVNRIISREFFTENATIKAANIQDLTATDIKGGVLSSLNNSMQFNLMSNHLEFNNDATIDFYSKNNMFRMIYPSSTRDNRNVIAGFGTTEASNGSNVAYFGGGHYDIDGTIKANDEGFAGLRVGGGSNDSRLTGTNVDVGSGNADNDMFFKFDFTNSGSSRYARFRPPTSADNYVLGGSNTPFHSIYTWRINRLRFTDLSGNTELRYDNGGTTGAGFRFTETDVYFVRGGLFSIKQAIDRADSAYDSINSDNGLREQLRTLANRVYALENK